MGQSTMMDILISNTIAGMIFLIALRMNVQAVEVANLYNTDYSLQTNMTTAVLMVEYDFRKIGFCAEPDNFPNGSLAITTAESSRIVYKADIDSNGTVNTIEYWLGATSDMSYTPNPYDRPIWRKVDSNSPAFWGLGFTTFRLRYFDALKVELARPVADPREIASMEITMAISGPATYDGQYTNDPSRYDMTWRQFRLSSRNIANR